MHNLRGLAILILTTALASLCAQAPVGSAHAGRHRFQIYGQDQGFPGASIIFALTQDEQGFMWIGTQEGLYRYDGTGTTRFGSTEGLPSDSVPRLYANPDGGIWVGTTEGLVRFQRGKVRSVTFEGPGKEVGAGPITADQEGHLYVGGLKDIYKQVGLDRFAPLPGWPGSSSVRTLCFGKRSGSLWAAGDQTLAERQSNGAWQRYAIPDGIHGTPGVIAEDGEGWVWLAAGRALYAKAPGSSTFEDRSTWMPGSLFAGSTSFLDRDGAIWLSTAEGALRLLGNSHTVLGFTLGLPSHWAGAVFRDREGSLWISSATLYRQLGQGCISVYTREEGLPGEVVWYAFRDRDGSLLVGTDDGAARLGPKGFVRIPGTEGATVGSIVQDAHGGLWFANATGPSLHLPPGAPRALHLEGPEAPTRTISLYATLEGLILFGTHRKGITAFDPRTNRFQPFLRADTFGLKTLGASIIRPDTKGRIWAAGISGLFCLDQGTWHRWTTAEGLKINATMGAYPLPDGTVWVWYNAPNGLTHVSFEGGQFKVLEQLDTSKGLHSNLVYGLVQAADGVLWASNDHGIDRIQGNQIRHFGSGEGFVSEDCGSNALMLDPAGDLWIGTSAGMVRLRTHQVPPPPPAPASFVLQMKTGAHAFSAPFGRLPAIPHAEASLVFHFSSPTFLNERALRYENRLLGLEDSWNATDIHQARYAALPGGHYRFEVRAAHPDGTFGKPAGLDVWVLPPWWRTWWCLLLEILAGAALIALAVRWRVRHLKEEQERLQALVEERTKGLNEANAALAGANQALLEQSFTDPLTGLHNRRYLSNTITEDIALALRAFHPTRRESNEANDDLVFFIVDLDKFKSVNDTYGHQAGDEVLKQLATVLRAAMRDSDSVIRWGGEEFVLLARATNRSEAPLLAERVRAAVEAHPFLLSDGTVLRCTASIGFAPFPFLPSAPEWFSWERGVDLADHGLYLVKSNGRNGWIGFEAGPALDASINPASLAGDLPGAVASELLTLRPCRPMDLTPEPKPKH